MVVFLWSNTTATLYSSHDLLRLLFNGSHATNQAWHLFHSAWIGENFWV